MRFPGVLSLTLVTIFQAVFLVGCQNMDPRLKNDTVYLGGYTRGWAENRPEYDNFSHWDGDGVSGAPSVLIRLGEQRAYFYKGGELVGVSAISTGREGFGTPSGSFRIQQKDKDHASSLYGDYVDAKGQVIQKDIDRSKDPMPKGARFDGAKMPFFMRITGGVGMHQG
ncbi:MAG: hypothetical protein RLZZ399_2458, partial [Verrucomicrobiota bacterium]